MKISEIQKITSFILKYYKWLSWNCTFLDPLTWDVYPSYLAKWLLR